MSPSRWPAVALSALASVALMGAAAYGQEAKSAKYPFAKPPLELYELLGQADLGEAEPFSADDKKLLGAHWKTRMAPPKDGLSQADDDAVMLHLLASGGTTPKSRREYLKKFDALIADAKEATADAKTDREKADRLLRFLHKGVMANGYDRHLTTLAEIFDTGKFNCVSSSSLYYLLGSRLGLKLQPILIPGGPYKEGHAAVDLLDAGERIDLEPTNADGYDWIAKLKRPGVTAVGPQPDRASGYDSDGFGLAASAASNLGRAASKAETPRPIEAIRHSVIALVLDPTDGTAKQNLTAEISNWGLKCADGGEFEKSLGVHSFGRKALGAAGNMERNHRVVWSRYLDESFKTGKVSDSLKLLARASADFPDDKDFGRPARWVTRAAHRRSTEGEKGWTAALALADGAAKGLDARDAKEVLAWKVSARRRWSQALLDGGDVTGSAGVLADGLAEAPDSEELEAGLAFHTQTALAHLESEKDTERAVAHFVGLTAKFPKSDAVKSVGLGHARRTVKKIAADRKYEAALKSADGYKALAGKDLPDLKGDVYDAWAMSLGEDGKWEAGLKKYAEGIAIAPEHRFLPNNAIVLIDRWADTAMTKRDWDEAIRIYDVGLKQFPQNGHLTQNRKYCESKK